MYEDSIYDPLKNPGLYMNPYVDYGQINGIQAPQMVEQTNAPSAGLKAQIWAQQHAGDTTQGLLAGTTMLGTMIGGLNLGNYNNEINGIANGGITNTAEINPADMSTAMQQINKPVTHDANEYGGKSVGQQIQSVGTGTASGAALGSAIMPGIGTAIGAVVGGIGSLTTGLIGQNKAKRAAKAANEAESQRQANAMATLQNAANNYTTNMQYKNRANILAEGGDVLNATNTFDDNSFNAVNTGGTHESNPFGGVPIGMAPDGLPNLVEQGEVIANDYVFSDRLKMPKSLINKYKLKAGTFADGIKEFKERGYNDVDGDNIAKKTFEAVRDDFMNEQEALRLKNMTKKNVFACGGHKHADGDFLRYLQPVGDALGLMYDAIDPYKPKTVDVAQHAREVSAMPITAQLRLQQVDPTYQMQQANALSSLTTGTIANSSSISKNAALLAAQTNALKAQADAYQQGVMNANNINERQASFNRATEQQNAQMGLHAQMTNAQNDNAYRQMLSQQAQYNTSMRDQWKRGTDAARGQELSNIFNSFGNMGREAHDLGLIRALADSGVFGTLNDNIAKASKIR